MNRRSYLANLILTAALMAVLGSGVVLAHSIHYQVEQQKGIAVRAYYSAEDPAGYAEYELYGPGDEEPYQTGRTDRNGYIGFVPDRKGIWNRELVLLVGFYFSTDDLWNLQDTQGIKTSMLVDKDTSIHFNYCVFIIYLLYYYS